MSELQSARFSYLQVGFFVAKRAEGVSENTVLDYEKYFRQFVHWGHDRVEFSPPDLRGFFAWLREQPNGRGGTLAAKSVYNAWVALRSFYRWHSDEMGAANPMLGIRAPRSPEPVVAPLSEEEVKAILKACEYTRPTRREGQHDFARKRPTAARDRALVLTLLDAGLRATEVCDLRVEDVDLATGRVWVRSGKGGRGRLAYLGKVARRALWRYLAGRQAHSSDSLFVTQSERPFDRKLLRHLLVSIGERAGVQHVHPHAFRHTFATAYLRNGGNLLSLQRLLGHASLEMVRRYAAIVEADLAKAHETGSPADNWRL